MGDTSKSPRTQEVFGGCGKMPRSLPAPFFLTIYLDIGLKRSLTLPYHSKNFVGTFNIGST